MMQIIHNQLKKILIVTTIITTVGSSYLTIITPAKTAKAEEIEQSEDPTDYPDQSGNLDDPGETDADSGRQIDPVIELAERIETAAMENSNTFSSSDGAGEYISKITDLSTKKSKLVFAPSDSQDIRILSCMGNAIPDFANHDDVLATATGRTIAEIEKIRTEKPADWKKLISQAQESSRQDLVSRLKYDLPNFACIAGVDETMAAEMLARDEESVNSIIQYAQEKIVIDRRVLLLLTNLVTPKNQGGAGHERIRVFRIRKGYDRDARMYSRESDAIREEMARGQESDLETIGDVAEADPSQISEDSEFSSAEAHAAVVSSTGANEGDLVFNDTEDDINISAHNRGEAIDISEIDNIRCTLVKKRRLGSDKRVPQPATPIKVGWQTSEGYDNSPPPDYSSLAMNLSQMASGQYLEMLDELGIDPDSEENLSDASFGDIVGLIGESLLAEILSSPSSSLSGYSLSDTAKKIGGMILADNLGLPRAPFIDSNLLDLDDLETKVGEAQIEKKLNLNYGSIRGNNMAEVLENIGLRHVEKQLEIKSGTITPGLSGPDLKIAIGRSKIEKVLKLEPGVFNAESNYSKLKENVGDRKIDFLFTNPTEIDEALGVDFGYSESYKNGSRDANSYATIIGAKVLADHAYIFNHSSASGMALRLDSNPAAGGSGQIIQGGNSSPLSGIDGQRGTSSARFNWIMSGTITPVAGVTTPGSFSEIYRAIGNDALSSALSSNSEVRTALSRWFEMNSASTSTDCKIKEQLIITIPNPRTGTEQPATIDITIPEDQIMATFGLRRGDIYRLFGCYNVEPDGVFKGVGEKVLLDAVVKSTLAQQARARFLSDHPEITNFLNDVDFYKTRIEEIKRLLDKVNNDWSGQNTDDPGGRASLDRIRTALGTLKSDVSSIDTSSISLSNIGESVRKIKQTPGLVDSIMGAINDLRSGSSDLRDKANETLVDVSVIIHNVDEILTGEEQPDVGTINIGELNTSGNGSSGSGGSRSISRAMLSLLLSKKLSPKDFLIAVGSSVVEDSLNLPANAILYYAKHLDDPGRDKNDGKNAFFRAIGQAEFEETFSMPPFFFQGKFPASNATLTDVKINVATSYKITEAEAGARIMRALRLPGEFSTIESKPIDSIATVMSAAKAIDDRLVVSEGTTATFLNGGTVDKANLGNTEVRMLAGKMNLPEEMINTFVRVRNGAQKLEDALKESYSITFNSHNEFARKPGENSSASSELADQCPVQFNINPQTGKLSSSFIEDDSYVYADQSGTHSFPSLSEAKNYANSVPQEQKVNFVQGIAQALSPNPEQKDQMTQQLNHFLEDPTVPQAFPDIETDLQAYADMNGIPINTLTEGLERRDLISRNENAKPIGSYLETIGKKTAERKIASTLLGGATMTFAGLQIDASDIFDLLDGNGLQVAYRIGSRFLEEELNIDQNLAIRILEAPTQILRNCTLANIGGGLLGSALGVGTISLSGNIYENVGAAKIETALGIPAESFRGANIEELVSNIGPAKFAAAFGIPSNIAAPSSVTTGIFGNSETGYLRLPMEDQMSELDRVLAYPDFVPSSTSDLRNAEEQIKTNVLDFLRRSDIWNKVEKPSSGANEYQLSQFQHKVSVLDPQLNLSAGKTKGLLTGAQSPDSYKRDVANQTLLTNADNILSALGLGEYRDYVTRGAALINIAQSIITNIKTCSDNNACGNVRESIFNNLQVLLGINFDAKLGLPDGTISMIIAEPQQAAFRLMSGALNRLDNSLGLVNDQGQPLGDASFSAAFGVWWRTDYKNCDADPQNCLQNSSIDNDFPIISGGLGGVQTVNRWGEIIENAGNQLIGDWLNDAGILPAELTERQTTGPFAGYPTTRELMRNCAELLMHGDLRILEIAAGVHGLRSLHFYKDGESDANVPDYFRISFEDVYYSIMGNPILDQQYADRATQNFLYNFEQENSPAPNFSNEAEMDNGALPIYASQCYPGQQASAGCVNARLLDGLFNGSDYNFYSNSDSYLNGPNNAVAGTAANPEATMQQVMMSPNASHELTAAQESARNQARSDNRNNLLWRMADAQIYQMDSNIPVGFSRTMYQGTGRQRTMMLLLYASNAINLNEIEIGGVSVGEISTMLPILRETINFFDDPNSFDLNQFVSSGHMSTLDGWLSERFTDFLGFDLQPGTFTSIFYGFKTGDFTFDSIRTGGTEIKGLTTIYTDWAVGKITSWADRQLGLPVGTTFSTYKMYRGLQSARSTIAVTQRAADDAQNVFDLANASGDTEAIANAQDGLDSANGNLAEAKGKYIELKAELISFIITTLFAKQIAAVEQALGLVPGTGAMLVSAAVSYFMTAAIPWVAIGMFVVMNLIGYYKTEIWCTADGYYPSIPIGNSTNPTGSGDSAIYDVAGLGTFDGMNQDARKDGYIEAARYKVRTVIGDALNLADRTGDETAVPSQIMTGRQEDVDYWNYKVNDSICDLIGGCAGTRAGLWKNIQATSYIHIGF